MIPIFNDNIFHLTFFFIWHFYIFAKHLQSSMKMQVIWKIFSPAILKKSFLKNSKFQHTFYQPVLKCNKMLFWKIFICHTVRTIRDARKLQENCKRIVAISSSFPAIKLSSFLSIYRIEKFICLIVELYIVSILASIGLFLYILVFISIYSLVLISINYSIYYL